MGLTLQDRANSDLRDWQDAGRPPIDTRVRTADCTALRSGDAAWICFSPLIDRPGRDGSAKAAVVVEVDRWSVKVDAPRELRRSFDVRNGRRNCATGTPCFLSPTLPVGYRLVAELVAA